MDYDKIYDKLSNSYDTIASRYKMIPMTHTIAKSQLERFDWNEKQLLDVGIGSGEFLHHLQKQYPKALLTGVDVSDKMLQLAKSKMQIATVHTNIEEIDQQLPHHKFDLLLAHNILSRVKLETVFEKAKRLLTKNGYLSLITSTFESFPGFQKTFSQKSSKSRIFGSIVSRAYLNRIGKNLVPKSYEDIKKQAQDHGFSVVEHKHFCEDMYFNNPQEVSEFWVGNGWIATFMAMSHLPSSIFHSLLKLYVKRVLPFPFKDKCIAEIVLFTKKA